MAQAGGDSHPLATKMASACFLRAFRAEYLVRRFVLARVSIEFPHRHNFRQNLADLTAPIPALSE
jgi:hypothetical protein